MKKFGSLKPKKGNGGSIAGGIQCHYLTFFWMISDVSPVDQSFILGWKTGADLR
jgi:hypothetical protein